MAKLTPDAINTTQFEDGQTGTITAAVMRSVVNSLAGLPSTTISEAAFTLRLQDDGTRIRMSSASVARNMTIPPHSSVAFDNDTVIAVFMALAGVVTIVAGAGVTIHTALPGLAMVQYQTIILQQDSLDVWIAS